MFKSLLVVILRASFTSEQMTYICKEDHFSDSHCVLAIFTLITCCNYYICDLFELNIKLKDMFCVNTCFLDLDIS